MLLIFFITLLLATYVVAPDWDVAFAELRALKPTHIHGSTEQGRRELLVCHVLESADLTVLCSLAGSRLKSTESKGERKREREHWHWRIWRERRLTLAHTGGKPARPQ